MRRRCPTVCGQSIWPEGSDSTSLDEALHLLERSGRNVLHSLSVLMPTAWEGNPAITPEMRAFYEYHAPILEPWDGPAGWRSQTAASLAPRWTATGCDRAATK